MSNNYKYSLQEPIGKGVFSVTYPAIEVNSQRPVIIKTLAENLTHQPDFRQLAKQFIDCAQRLHHCRHPHIPEIWECFTEDEMPYVVYDRVLGPTLADYVNAHGAIPENLTLHWIGQIATALQAYHQANVLHLDVHPGNIIYRKEWDDVVLVDVGIAINLTPEITQTHANLRPAGYAAPEQYNAAAAITPATDLYALSATLYFCLTGTAPPPAPLRAHIPTAEWFHLPSQVNPALEQLILQGLHLDPHHRPASPELWLREFNHIVNPAPEPTVPEALEPNLSDAPTLPPLNAPAPRPQKAAAIAPPQARPAQKAARKPAPRPKKPAGAVVRQVARPFPVGALVMTSIVAASAGAGFGLSLRLNRPAGPGSTFWHLEQSFPPKE
jgi:serine/threonine-protein kinase